MSIRTCAEKLSLLGKISEAVIASDDLNAVTLLIIDLTIDFFKAEKGFFLLVDNRQELVIASSRGMDRESARSWRGKVGQGIYGTVVATGMPLLCRDLKKDPRFKDVYHEPCPSSSFITSPIIGKNRVLGVLAVNDRKSWRPFDEADLALLQAVSAQTALALEKILLAVEFQEKVNDIEEANRRLIVQDIDKTEFLTRVSHELRTPLNAIKGAVHLLQNARIDDVDGRQEFQEIVAGETERLLGMVNRQLDFLSIENESRVLRKIFLSLDAVLRDVLHISVEQNSLSYRHLAVELDLPYRLEDVVGDKILVGQMFVHLLDGLAAYLTRSAKLRVSIRETDMTTVSFQAFQELPDAVQDGFLAVKNIYRADRPEESIKFYLAMKVAENHGWRLNIGNAKEGFRVVLQIPRSEYIRRDAALSMVMDRALGFVSELLGVDTCSLMLSDDLTGELTIRSSRGLDEWIVQQTRIRMGERISGWVALGGQPLLIEDIETDKRFARKNINGQYRSKSLLSLPLISQGRAIGVLNLNNKKNGAAFSREDLALATAVCERVSQLIERTSQNCGHEGQVRELVAGLDKLLVAENRYRKKHDRYADLLAGVMRQLGDDDLDEKVVRYVSQVYDLGLITLDDRLLVTNRSSLSFVERLAIKNHPLITLDMLGTIEFSDQVVEAILHHHEQFDGCGYPDGLRGEEIPIMARALAVVDAYCAMTENRPYRGALSQVEALRELSNGAGSLYDPRAVDALRYALVA